MRIRLKGLLVCLPIIVIIVAFGNMISINRIQDHINLDELVASLPLARAKLPDMVWLMSYPNSGTTYTMDLVVQSTRTTVATNYGEEPIQNGHEVKALCPHSPEGPFISDPTLSLPSRYILTKTHCSGYCSMCRQNKYVINEEGFLRSCSECKRPLSSYHEIVVPSKLVRLVRDPFDNIVSNYHHWLKKQMREKPPKLELSNYNAATKTNEAIGFKKFCNMMDDKYLTLSKIQPKIKQQEEFFKNVPCHQSFFRYITWHNNADYVAEFEAIPTLVIHYSDYEQDYNATTASLFQFLDLKPDFAMPAFKTGKTYHDLFTREEREAAWKLMKNMAKASVWDKLQRYRRD